MDPIIYAAAISAVVPVLGIIVTQWLADKRSNKIAAKVNAAQLETQIVVKDAQAKVEQVHKLVNSEMTDFKANMHKLMEMAVTEALARGELAGVAKEKAEVNKNTLAEQRGAIASAAVEAKVAKPSAATPLTETPAK